MIENTDWDAGISEDAWNTTIAPAIMRIPGMRSDCDSDFVAEPDTEGVTSYIKFMSDKGITDDHNGAVLAAYLRENGCIVNTTRPRSMVVSDADIIRLFMPTV